MQKVFAFIIIILISPALFVIAILIFFHDLSNPIYFGKRVGENNKIFNQFKFRSMKINQRINYQSTSDNDERITTIGKFLRKYKLDELPQLFNILLNNMKFVGPRPNVLSETSKYFENERKLLTVKPGITDFSSIVFSDEGSILEFSENPEQDYNELIRFWKNSLGLIYIKHRSFFLDIYLIFLTILNFFNRKKTLNLISQKILSLSLNYKEISLICLRSSPLTKITFNNSNFEIYK